ncbi:NAD(P)H-hydrate dehydratase [uncultured Limosilactobacillus sp.]|uniref:NAD(P)H-hydrate dehydratase n=1 Tax=uncultured Limosilactobacillus sp. TaxID=2837629 RepID=UPI0025EA57FE|nr:NAD(P)H-hydrate dehydratase [uncultured Limosilactobacillus sp.]
MQALSADILKEVITPRPVQSYKGTFGRCVLIGGNNQFGGAIIMATMAAVYAGTGLVTAATDPINITALRTRVPEAMVIDYQDFNQLATLLSSANSIVVGPGLGETETSLKILKFVFNQIHAKQNLVIDGSAITLVANHHLTLPKAQIIFTPHEMEWQRLSRIAIVDQTEVNNRAAQAKLGAMVMVKKHHTEIYTDQNVYQLTIGTPAQATGGMGDTLAGMVGAFTAQFRTDYQKSTLAAVYAHSAIAEELAANQYVVLPTQISAQLPQFMHQISQPDEQPIGFI